MKLYICYGTFLKAPRPGGTRAATPTTPSGRRGTIRSWSSRTASSFTILPSFMNSSRGRKEVRELTGKDTVPVLVTDEGEVITESRVIADWAKAHPAA